jgi:hypothetical protein
MKLYCHLKQQPSGSENFLPVPAGSNNAPSIWPTRMSYYITSNTAVIAHLLPHFPGT